MKRAKACLVLLAVVFSVAGGLSAADPTLLKLRPVPFTSVEITDSFWAPRQEINRTVSIPVNLENLVTAGNIKNFQLAAAKAREGFQGPVFMDSDVYKALEAASYSLATHPDPALERRLDEIIAVLAAAQQPDGYLNTYFTVVKPEARWTNLRDWHELYCAGHLFEAAVAHYQATGKRSLLDVAVKYADYIDSVFGPGKRMGYPGHPEIELALVKLSRVTGERRYFELARFFITNRGRHFFAEEHNTPPEKYDGAYWQDDVPIAEHANIKGHAVRACYLLSGATDVAAETGDPALLKMIRRVWRNTVEKNMYITGGIGPSAHNEGFTSDYDLPNESAYQETCATVALAQWNHRLALLYADSRFADIVERALYNGVLAGVSNDGKCFFYVNPLESRGDHHRSPWFGCACCPPNVARTIASLGGYAYAVGDNSLWVNLYVQGAVKADVGGKPVRLTVRTDYPWDGIIRLAPEPAKATRFELRLRVPAWAREAVVSVNGERLASPTVERGYLVLNREWRRGDAVELQFPMPVERLVANPNVKQDRGLVALQRGPIVYCLESADHDAPLSSVYLPPSAELQPTRTRDVAGGAVVLTGFGEAAAEQDWTRKLYQSAAAGRRIAIKAIPYFAWDNRQPGDMRVWLPTAPPAPPAGGLEARADVTASFEVGAGRLHALNDGNDPTSSIQSPPAPFHWYPHRGSDEWAQYTWKQPATVDGVKVYWFDDTGRGDCRLPVSWRIEYRDADQWKPVKAKSEYLIAKDRWCQVQFEKVTTHSLRLLVKLQNDWAAGVQEWRVSEADEE